MNDYKTPSGLPDRKPEIQYPLPWNYQVIGADEALLRQAIKTAIAEGAGNAKHEITTGNRSKGGRYCSLHLTVTVFDEAQRLHIFELLDKDPDVVFVL